VVDVLDGVMVAAKAMASVFLVLVWMACQASVVFAHGDHEGAPSTGSAAYSSGHDAGASHAGRSHGDHSSPQTDHDTTAGSGHCSATCVGSIMPNVELLFGTPVAPSFVTTLIATPASLTTGILIPPPNTTL
jgi:hypothetical protein